FLAFGLVAFVWLWPWLAMTRNAPSVPEHHEGSGKPPPFAEILSLRALWGSTLGHFASNYVLYFVLSWLPLYLVKERGFSIVEMSQLGAVIYGVFGVSCIALGWMSDRWIASG